MNLERGSYRAQQVFQQLAAAGWQEVRVSGSHHIFRRAGRSCLPVAVHGGKLRRDAVQHILRQAGLCEDLDNVCDESIHVAPAEAIAVPESLVIAEVAMPAARVGWAEHKWAESTDDEVAVHRSRAQEAEAELRERRSEFRQVLDSVQIDLVDGKLEAVDSRLTPILGLEQDWDGICAQYGFDLVSDGLFFLATALAGLAISGGPAAFSEVAQQRHVKRAFVVCKRLMLDFKDRRDESRALLARLLSWVFHSYVLELFRLSLSAGFEEFHEDGLYERALRQQIRARGVPSEDDNCSPVLRKLLGSHAETMPETALIGRSAVIHNLCDRPELNGSRGVVVDYSNEDELYEVLVDDMEQEVFIRRANLRPLTASDEEQDEEEVLAWRRASVAAAGLAPADRSWAPSAAEDAAAEQRGAKGANSEHLSELQAQLRCGFNFIVGLAREEIQILESCSASAEWSLQGLVALTRGTITHYERGALAESRATFEAILHVTREHARHFADEDASSTEALKGMTMHGVAVSRPSTMVIIQTLAQACIRMCPAHEYAAQSLAWSRSIGFGDVLQDQPWVKPAAKCWSTKADGPMFRGWSDVLERARQDGAVREPFSWPKLCEFMQRWFSGMEYCVANTTELKSGAALLFVVQNLHDPAMMLQHHLRALHQSCEPLREACVLDGESPVWKTRESSEEACDELIRPAHKPLRRQLITMMRWLVQLHGLIYRLNGFITKQVSADEMAIRPILCGILPRTVEHLCALIRTCCVERDQSTQIDLHMCTLQLWGRFNISAFPGSKDVAYSIGKAVGELSGRLSEYLKWFALPNERKQLAIVFGVVCQLKGFGADSVTRTDQKKILHCQHDGRFCAYSLLLLEFLSIPGSMTWELFADAMLDLTRRDGDDLGSGRLARRGAEVQKTARRYHLLVTQTIKAHFSPGEVIRFRARRHRLYTKLFSVYTSILAALRSGLPTGGLQRGTGNSSFMTAEMLERVGAALNWSQKDVYHLDAQVDELTELAAEVNLRMCEAFGGNFQALVWQSDVFEFDAAHVNEKEHQRGFLDANAGKLHECISILENMVERGVIPEPVPPIEEEEAEAAVAGAATSAEGQCSVERPASSNRARRQTKGSKKKR